MMGGMEPRAGGQAGRCPQAPGKLAHHQAKPSGGGPCPTQLLAQEMRPWPRANWGTSWFPGPSQPCLSLPGCCKLRLENPVWA